jgi:hypothetical protein
MRCREADAGPGAGPQIVGGAAAAGVVTERLLLDEHDSEAIAASLRTAGHDVLAVVADDELRAASDAALFEWAADGGSSPRTSGTSALSW